MKNYSIQANDINMNQYEIKINDVHEGYFWGESEDDALDNYAYNEGSGSWDDLVGLYPCRAEFITIEEIV